MFQSFKSNNKVWDLQMCESVCIHLNFTCIGNVAIAFWISFPYTLRISKLPNFKRTIFLVYTFMFQSFKSNNKVWDLQMCERVCIHLNFTCIGNVAIAFWMSFPYTLRISKLPNFKRTIFLMYTFMFQIEFHNLTTKYGTLTCVRACTFILTSHVSLHTISSYQILTGPLFECTHSCSRVS